MKKADSRQASLEEDLPPTRPMDTVAQQDVLVSDAESKSSDTPGSPSSPTLPGASSEMEEKVAPAKPSRPKRHFSSGGTIESVNLDAIPLAIARLDNSAAKHKLAVKPKNQRVSKKHRRLGLAGERPKEQGGLPRQLSLDQNGHPGEDKPTWPEEEPEPLDSEEEQRRQEEYWRELEAKCKRQKAEAAERRRREEQRLQALERRLWEENRRQALLEQEGEEEEGEPQLEAGNRPRPEERQGPEERGGRGWECREPETGGQQAAEEQERPGEEAERPPGLARQEELEAQSRREAEKQREEEDRARRELRRLEELEEQRRQEAEKQRQEGEERKRQEEEERKRQEEEERKRQEEEERKRLEEQRRQEAEKQRQEEEEKRLEELRRQQELEERRREEEEEERTKELRRQEELEEQRRREEEEPQEAPAVSPPESDRSPTQTDFAEDPEQGPLEPEKLGEDAGQPRGRQKQSQEAEPAGEQQGELGRVRGQERREQRSLPPPRKQEGLGDTPAPAEKEEAATPEKGRKVEELRWQEVDERQTMPRPYTFQVSSGGKQILFPKVNLSPVTPVKDAGPASAAHEPKAPKASPAPHALPLSLSVPHTAILVTGAQLCGPAVNLSQIKDTACKSLLGLSEEKKHVDVPTLENPPRALADPRAGSGKARPPQESPSSAAALAEWASIRSRILKNAESDQHSQRDQSQPGDEHTPRGRCDSRGSGNLRKTQLGNAKFSIMPAWQKFSDGGTETSKRNTEAESIRRRPMLGASDKAAPLSPAAESKDYFKGTENLGVHQEPTDTTEGCKFAKDLPSFLVPSLPCPPQNAVAQAEPVTTLDSGTTRAAGAPDPGMPGGEEKASPFGIKLRRTNYSLRFHCDQQTEKKKKRLSSTGDGADGGPPAPGSTDGEKETEGVALKHGQSLTPERKQAPSTWEDSAVSPASPSPAVQPGPPSVSSQAPAPEHKAANRMPLAQKPALAPKPAGQTPPSSPLCKLSRPYLMELLAGRQGKPDPEPGEPGKEDQESSEPQLPSPPPAEERKAQKREEEEVDAERKAAFPALPAAPAEKPSQIPEAGRKDRPVLQSRHSLDGSRLAEKAETSQPLWITLALQKQKGFREQQATREERKQAREAKQAGKLSRDHASVGPQPGSSGVSRAGSLHKPEAQPEERPETAVSRLERREQLRKANTLPASVTVEISDSTAPAPLVKEVTKRFSTPDAAPVSTEPAWLALAKRKAKAWSDCPQIIK